MRSIVSCLLISTLLVLTGCATQASKPDTANNMTLGTVQRSIHKGMSQSSVAEALGSPNIVTRDSDGNETWIYDMVASYASYKNSSVYGTILIFGGSSGSASTTTGQRTLTVIVKFDKQHKVKSFSYNSSKF